MHLYWLQYSLWQPRALNSTQQNTYKAFQVHPHRLPSLCPWLFSPSRCFKAADVVDVPFPLAWKSVYRRASSQRQQNHHSYGDRITPSGVTITSSSRSPNCQMLEAAVSCFLFPFWSGIPDEWRILLVDQHGSHLTVEFVQRCTELQILLFVMPPHLTHLL